MTTNINLPFITAGAEGPKHLDMDLTRAKFDELTADLVERTMEPTRKAMADAGLSASDINKGYLGRRFFPYSCCTGSFEKSLSVKSLTVV